MAERLQGQVQSGVGNASHWLALLNDAYCRKLGMPIYPGSLNLRLSHEFDWADSRYQKMLIWFPRAENGGERDILLLPCVLENLADEAAFLWTTTTAVAPEERSIIEILASVNLRQRFRLKDRDTVIIRLESPPD